MGEPTDDSMATREGGGQPSPAVDEQPPELVRPGEFPLGSGTCRPLLPPRRQGWEQVVMGEWELLAGQGFGDCHPHDEVSYVLEGELEVDAAGTRVVAGPGDVVRVPAGSPAYYYAPTYARMLYIYGPNPGGQPAWTFTDRSRVAPPEPTA
jgi:quercetin dioxygenase-like cupin family protein